MRTIGKLGTTSVTRMKRPGVYSDGGGLYLQITTARARSWLYRYFVGERDPATGEPIRDPKTGKIKGRTRDMGLGSCITVGLEEARGRAAECRRLRAEGVDPLDRREETRRQAILDKARAVTFRQSAEAYIEAHRPGWRNAVHAAQWPSSLENDVYPVIGALPVQTIDTDQLLKVLRPIWSTKPETASRIRGRIEAVLDAARAQGHIAQGVANPARWKGHLENLLAKQSKVRRIEHHPALPYVEIPAFMASLRAQDGVAARALEFTVLTAARTGETLGAQWSEIDFAGKVWTIPGSRMKAAKDHRVPLSKRAMAILAERRGDGGDFVFSRSGAGKPSSRVAMLQQLARMGRINVTTHGFRSSFNDWAAERTHFPNHVVQMALAHSIRSAVEAAYRRGDLIEQRRQLMDDWDRFCASSPATMGEVIPLNAGRATTSA